jgi:hypothetical protein
VRLDLQSDGEETVIHVTLSERNLLALLQKLAMPGSARTLASAHAYRHDELVDDLTLVVQVEDDDAHYGERGFPPGPMHPQTEQFLAQFRERRRNGQ